MFMEVECIKFQRCKTLVNWIHENPFGTAVQAAHQSFFQDPQIQRDVVLNNMDWEITRRLRSLHFFNNTMKLGYNLQTRISMKMMISGSEWFFQMRRFFSLLVMAPCVYINLAKSATRKNLGMEVCWTIEEKLIGVYYWDILQNVVLPSVSQLYGDNFIF